MRFLVSILLAALALPAAAQNAGINRQFGNNGIASLRDTTQVNSRQLGLAACAAPGGGLNVLAATELNKLTLFRVDVNGDLVRSFGDQGIVNTIVPPSGEDTAQGACMADGRIVVVRMAAGVGEDKNVQLIRVMPDGTLDPSFSQDGSLTLDFDTHVPGLGHLEFPLGLNLDTAAKLYTPTGVTGVYASAAGLGPNGRIWLIGGGNPTGTPFNSWFRSEIDPVTGNLITTFAGADGNYVVDGGRVLASGVMVIAAKYVPQSQPGGAYQPRLLVFRESGANAVILPQPFPINSFEPSLAPFPGHGVAIPIADGRVLQGSPLGAMNQEWERATYAAVIEIGATAAEDRVDTRFGTNGAVQFAYRTQTACANGSPTLQRPVRFSNWLGRPVLAGIHATTCDNNPRNAFAARLLLPTDIFAGSFED